jgi:hypothetical protein
MGLILGETAKSCSDPSWLRSPAGFTVPRLQTPSEVVLRLLVLKHVRDWSYETLEGEVRANLAYRAFARIGGEKVPDAKTMGRLGQAIGGVVTASADRGVGRGEQAGPRSHRGVPLLIDLTLYR